MGLFRLSGGIVYDKTQGKLSKGGQQITLEFSTRRFLSHMVDNVGTEVSNDQLQQLLQSDSQASTNPSAQIDRRCTQTTL